MKTRHKTVDEGEHGNSSLPQTHTDARTHTRVLAVVLLKAGMQMKLPTLNSACVHRGNEDEVMYFDRQPRNWQPTSQMLPINERSLVPGSARGRVLSGGGGN